MSADNAEQRGEHAADEEVYPGIWECGTCHQFTDVTHYVTDRMTGHMQHSATEEGRARYRERCGWSSTYNGWHQPPVRCALRHDHRGSHDPQIHGFGGFSERYGGAIPPYDPATANTDDFGGHNEPAAGT